MIQVLAAVLAIIGTVFMFLASLGMVRFPDVFCRMHAATKGGTVGMAGVFLAVAFHFGSLEIVAESLLVIGFAFLTAPVGAHVIARAAHAVGVPAWDKTFADELSNPPESLNNPDDTFTLLERKRSSM